MKSKFPLTEVAQGLFFLNAAIWLVFSLLTYVDILHIYTDQPGQKAIVIVIMSLMLGNSGAMAVSGFLISRQIKWFFLFALFVLAINILLTFTDQFGFIDFATLVLDLVLFAILISIRKQYLSNP